MKNSYYPSINILRGIAALMVCVYHFTNYSDDLHGDLFLKNSLIQRIGEYGTLGVFVFFIITGFVIPLSLIKYKFRLNQLHKFLAKRWLRIEIPYLASIALVLCVSFIFSIKNNTLFTVDLTRLFHHVFYSAPFFNYDWYNPIYWTLAIEMQFYILIALIYPLLKSENKLLKSFTPLILALSAFIVTDHRLVFHYGPIFSQGILLLLVMKKKIEKYHGVIFISLCALITIYTNGIDIALVSLFTVGVIAFININKKTFNRFGDISYSLYLTHGLIGGNLIYLLGRHLHNFYAKVILVLIALIVSLITSYIYWRIVERPSMKLSKRIILSDKT